RAVCALLCGCFWLFGDRATTGTSPLSLHDALPISFGFAVADTLGTGWRRLVGAHLMIDESVAFALAQPGQEQRRRAYWVTGVGLFVCWNVGVLAGAVAGTAITDTNALRSEEHTSEL